MKILLHNGYRQMVLFCVAPAININFDLYVLV